MGSNSFPKPIVTVAWLSDHIKDDQIVILDGTIPKVGGKEAMNEGLGIPAALFFDLKGVFRDKGHHLPNMMPTPEQFEEEARNLGISPESKIVVYDRYGLYSSARVWWMFKVMGHKQVAVLDGGLPAWEASGNPIQPIKNDGVIPGQFRSDYQPSLICDAGLVLENIDRNEYLLLDARSAGRFEGTSPEPRAHLRSGHIPKSWNVPYTSLLEEGKLKSETDLKAIFNPFIETGKPLMLSCGSGITACVLALAASCISKNSLCVYDGSWTDWGSRKDLPLET